MIKIAHLVDDCSMGGVMVSLTNFHDPRMSDFSESEMIYVNPEKVIAPRVDADVIIIHFTVNWRKIPFLTSLRLRNKRSRIILEEHSYTEGFERWNVTEPFRFHQMLRLSYGCVDDVVAVSYAQATWLSKIVRSTKITAIPQSRVLDGFRAVSPISNARHRPIVFGAIGRFHEQKGFDTLIAAFRDPALDNARLLIAGAGEEEARLRALAEGASNIEFVGRIEQPGDFYSQVDCVVIPSRWEAFGLVASEAIAAGRFVIASKTDGLTEQVFDRGILVEPENITRLSRTMKSVCMVGPGYLMSMCEQSRDLAFERYDMMIEAWRSFLTGDHSRRDARASSAADFRPIPMTTSPGQ